MPQPDVNDPPVSYGGYSLQFFSGEHDPTGETSFFVGASPVPPTLEDDPLFRFRVRIPYSGTLKWFSFQVRVDGTPGSSEPQELNIRIANNSGRSDALYLGDVLLYNSECHEVFQDIVTDEGGPILPAMALVQKGDFMLFQVTLHTIFATPPTDVHYHGQVWIEIDPTA